MGTTTLDCNPAVGSFVVAIMSGVGETKLSPSEGTDAGVRDATKPPPGEASGGTNDYVSGTQPPPVSSGFLLFALFAVFVVVTGTLFLANYVPSLAAYVDASFFQVMLSLLVCFVIGVFIFGFTAGATARMQIHPGAKVAISFGGAIAAVAGLFWIVLPNLTPTTTLTVYLRDGRLAPASSQSEFSVPEGVDIVLQLSQGRTVKTIINETQFGILPKGVEIPVTLAGSRWAIAGLEPENCAAPWSGQHVIKAGCRVVWIRVVPAAQAKFSGLADLPPTGLGFPDKQEVSLRLAISALIDELQKAATARDPNVVVGAPDWNALGPLVAEGKFLWKGVPSGAKACVFVRLIEQAFNEAHPNDQVFVVLLASAVEVERKKPGARPNDACT
jgi:hypothetical protein